MDEKRYQNISDFKGLSVPKITKWEELDINFHIVAQINQDQCIHCGLCYIVCEDTSHQSISKEEGHPYNTYKIKEEECVGCNLCEIVCPVDGCITMKEQRKGEEYLNWKEFQKRGLALNDH
jgi:dihydropyrimidine dehydrogenase (NAD+) subunit PreA